MAAQAKQTLRNVKQGTPYAEPIQEITASAEVIGINSGTVIITKATAATGIVLDDPPNVDGLVLRIISRTAAAHTVTNASGSGFNGAGASGDVGTFTAAVLAGLTLVSYGGVWYELANVTVTIA